MGHGDFVLYHDMDRDFEVSKIAHYNYYQDLLLLLTVAGTLQFIKY